MEDKKKDMTAKDIDEKLTEQDALQRAADEGIYFVDHYQLLNMITGQQLPDRYDTKAEAEKAMQKLDNAGDYQIVQVRERQQ